MYFVLTWYTSITLFETLFQGKKIFLRQFWERDLSLLPVVCVVSELSTCIVVIRVNSIRKLIVKFEKYYRAEVSLLLNQFCEF